MSEWAAGNRRLCVMNWIPPGQFRRLYRERHARPEWQAMRAKVFSAQGRYCAECGATRRLTVHHLHYRTLGHESVPDFRVLCKNCHKRGRYSSSEIDRDRHSMKLLAVILFVCWRLPLMPFKWLWRLATWLLKKTSG